MRSWLTAVIVGTAALGRGVLAQAGDTSESGGGAASVATPRLQSRPTRMQSFIDLFTVGGYDSNADGEPDGQASIGGTLGARGTFRSAIDDPLLELSYEVGGHFHGPDPRWNRLSQSASAVFAQRLGRSWRGQVRLEASLSGSSEDRDLGDVYMIRPRLERRVGALLSVRVDAAYRIKRDAESSEKDAINRYVAMILRARPMREVSLDLGVRDERNAAVGVRNSYSRRTYGVTAHGVAFGRDTIEAELKWQAKQYWARVIPGDDVRILRNDRRLTPAVSWMRPLTTHAWIRITCGLEERSSNDPAKGYSGHAVALMVARRW